MVTQAEQISALQTQLGTLISTVQKLTEDNAALQLCQTAATTSSTPVVYEENPYAGKINPSTSSGLKLFQLATVKRDKEEKLSASITKNLQFIDAMHDDAAAFGWGAITAQIGTSNNDMLQDFKDIDTEKVRLEMNAIFLFSH